MGKTTVVLKDDLLRQAIKATGAKSKREAIEMGLRELVRRRNLELFREELGTYDIELTQEELERRRSED